MGAKRSQSHGKKPCNSGGDKQGTVRLHPPTLAGGTGKSSDTSVRRAGFTHCSKNYVFLFLVTKGALAYINQTTTPNLNSAAVSVA